MLDAYAERDADKALAVWRDDAQIDAMYNSLFRELLTYMMEDPRNIGICTHLLFGAKNIERIGDHTTNIAETVHFLVRGFNIADDRPKDDQTSSTLISRQSDDGGWRQSACPPRFSIVEDEAPLAEMLRYNLEAEGFRVVACRDRRGSRDPRRGGAPRSHRARLDAAGRLGHRALPPAARQADSRNVPILMLTARGEESDRIRGLVHRRRRLCGQAVLAARADGAGARRSCAARRPIASPTC